MIDGPLVSSEASLRFELEELLELCKEFTVLWPELRRIQREKRIEIFHFLFHVYDWIALERERSDLVSARLRYPAAIEHAIARLWGLPKKRKAQPHNYKESLISEDVGFLRVDEAAGSDTIRYLQITPKGLEFIERFAKQYFVYVRRLYASVASEDLEETGRILRKIRDSDRARLRDTSKLALKAEPEYPPVLRTGVQKLKGIGGATLRSTNGRLPTLKIDARDFDDVMDLMHLARRFQSDEEAVTLALMLTLKNVDVGRIEPVLTPEEKQVLTRVTRQVEVNRQAIRLQFGSPRAVRVRGRDERKVDPIEEFIEHGVRGLPRCGWKEAALAKTRESLATPASKATLARLLGVVRTDLEAAAGAAGGE